MYISTIFIRNFQSHEETYLELSPGVNAFAGDTDSGKSSVFRALIWLFTNRPTGEEFRSHWGGSTEVSVCLQPENQWIGRVRGKSDNYYWIGDDIPGNRHAGFGNGPPPKAVLEVLNLGDVNFQAQMTLPFLLSLGATQAGKFFNESADLEIIDRSYSNVDKAEYADRTARDAAKKDNEVKAKQLKAFDWLDRAEEELYVCEQEEAGIEELVEHYNDLAETADSIEAVEAEIHALAPILRASGEVASCLVVQREIDQTEPILFALRNLTSDAKDVDSKIEGLQAVFPAEQEILACLNLDKEMAALESKGTDLWALKGRIENVEEEIAELGKVLPADKEIQACLRMVQEINKTANEQSRLLIHKVQFEDVERKLVTALEELAEMERRFHESFPDICPLCEMRQAK